MGQAKNRKAEIEFLKGQQVKWTELRPLYVEMIQEDQKIYMDKILACGSNIKEAMEIMKSGSNFNRAIPVGINLVKFKIATVAQIKDAAWQGFNGLLEASVVEQNIQHILGLPVSKINPDDFIISGPDAVEKAITSRWVV